MDTTEPVWIILGRDEEDGEWFPLQVLIGRREDAVEESSYWINIGYRTRIREGQIDLKNN